MASAKRVVKSKASPNGKAPPLRSPALLDDIVAYIRRFVVLTDEQVLVIALWVVHTHCIEHIEQTPYLSITSPDSECGKSRLMEVLELVVRRAWMIIRPSDAVVYRFVNDKTPTMLLDEADTIFNDQNARFHEGLRAVLDAGHRRGATVVKSADFGKSVDHFSPFCPKALAGIGSLPDTISRRSIYIRLARKTKAEEVDRFIHRDVVPAASALDGQIAAWAAKHGEAIGTARPAMPQELSDRMIEGCESLVAIADALGRGDDARTAIVELLTGERLDNAETQRKRLLRDLKVIWDARERQLGRPIVKASTQELIMALSRIEESAWDNYYGRGVIEPNDLASLLRHYGVKSVNVKIAGKVLKGYRRDHLQEAWERYLEVAG